MYRHGESLSNRTLDQQVITCKNKINTTSDTSITGKEMIQEPFNPRKRAKEDSIIYVEKLFQKKHLHRLKIR